MDRSKRAAILAAISLFVLALLLGRWFLESNSESENGLAWEGAAPDVEAIFASKRSAAHGSGNATRHAPASSDRAVDQAEGELVRAASALDQAHARLAATMIVVSLAEADFEQAERRITDLKALGEDSADYIDSVETIASIGSAEEVEERLALALEARERAKAEREIARRERAIEQASVRSAEERVATAELELQSSLSRE